MWIWTVFLATPSLANDPNDAALLADGERWLSRADKVAKKACKGQPKPCRKELARHIRTTLIDPDDLEAEEALLAKREQGVLPADFASFLFESAFREAQWTAQDICLGEAAESARRDAPEIARALCADAGEACIESTTQLVQRLTIDGPWNPDPYLNELDAFEETTKSARALKAVRRLRGIVEQTACRP